MSKKISFNDAISVARQIAEHDQAKIDRLEAINAELLEVLGYLVKIDRRDNIGDPDMTATDAWRIAYELVGEAKGTE